MGVLSNSAFDPAAGKPQGEATGDIAGRQNMLQLIQLRWIAVIGQIVTIVFAQHVLRIQLPLPAMTVVLSSLVGLNFLSQLHWGRPRGASNIELMGGVLIDVAALTALLYLSGGATNPFVFLYPLQLSLGAMLLESWSTWSLAALTALCFAGLTRFYVPLRLPPGDGPDLFQLHILGMLVCFLLDATLLVIFMSRINRNLRRRDSRLADLRQRAAEEDHIVRIGLLASGAAHELGTPLATLSVILGDLRRMPVFRDEPELLQEIDDMQTEVQRCKSIVTGILLSAGEARGESPVFTTLAQFVEELVAEWHSKRPAANLHYERHFDEDRVIISDSALRQVIGNVLDNALEASPQWVRLSVDHDGEILTLSVQDRGSGFAPEMLAQLGKPYQSTKGRPGGGLGLFLVMNVMRKLGGQVTAENVPPSGALVALQLPLSVLTIDEGVADHA